MKRLSVNKLSVNPINPMILPPSRLLERMPDTTQHIDLQKREQIVPGLRYNFYNFYSYSAA